MSDKKIKNVAFFGWADAKADSDLYKDTFEAAAFLAQEGFVIVNGGGPGVMEAATKGAESAKGETLVVTFYPENATGFEGRYVGNKADHEITTYNYIERMFTLMEHSDMFVIFNGGTGTLSELGTAWVLAKLYFGHHKPFILYGGFWRPVIAAIEANMMIRPSEKEVYKIVETKEELLKEIEAYEIEVSSRPGVKKTSNAEEPFML